MVQIISILLNIPVNYYRWIPWNKLTAEFSQEISAEFSFSSSSAGWCWQFDQVEFTLLDAMWVMAVLALILMGVIYGATKSAWNPFKVGISAVVMGFACMDMGVIFISIAMNMVFRMIVWVGPNLARLWIR